jgi:hypothetical protein
LAALQLWFDDHSPSLVEKEAELVRDASTDEHLIAKHAECGVNGLRTADAYDGHVIGNDDLRPIA